MRCAVRSVLTAAIDTCTHSPPTPHSSSVLGRKCYYPGALALYAELDRGFARRTQGALARLRASQRPHPCMLAPAPSAPGEGSSPEGDSPRAAGILAGASPTAAAAAAAAFAERTPPPEPEWMPLGGVAEEHHVQRDVQQPAAGAAGSEDSAAAGGAAAGGAAARVVPPQLGPHMRHASSNGGGSSFGRPPRSPRPGSCPRPLHLSPQSSRQLPAGEPLASPSGGSPRSSSGALMEDSLAGSTWGASTLQTRNGGGGGSAELVDTLTSRLRPLITSASGAAARFAPQQARSECGPAVQPHQEGSNLVFLSARPESYKASGCVAGWVGVRK